MSVRSRPAGGFRGIISTSHRDGTMLSLAVAMEVSSVTTSAPLDPIPPSVLAWLASRYPQSERRGTIEARWR